MIVGIEQWKIKLEEEANSEIVSADNGIWYCGYFGEGEKTMNNLRRRKGEERKRRRKGREEGEEEKRE